MTDWKQAEKIYKKLAKEGDITWQESDVIYQIVYDYLYRDTLDEDDNKRRDFLKSWYNLVIVKLNSGKTGTFLHTALVNPRERILLKRMRYKSTSNIIYELLHYINMFLQKLEGKDKATILTFKTKEDASNFFKGKMKLRLTGRKYQGFDRKYQYTLGINPPTGNWPSVTDLYQKYFFEIYRPLTLTRVGFDSFVKLDIEDENFKKACVIYGCSKKVYGIQEVYERAIEIMLDMNIPLYAYSTSLFTELSKAEFDMFVDERYAEYVDRIFRSLPYAIDSRFFETCKKNDEKFTDAVRRVIKDLMFDKFKDAEENDSWIDVIR